MLRHRFAGIAVLELVAIISVAACGTDQATVPPTPAPATIQTQLKSIGLVASASSVAMAQGESRTLSIRVVRPAGFSAAVDLAIDGAPAGITSSLSLQAMSLSDTVATLTVGASSSAPVGQSVITVRARAAGATDAAASVALTITAATPSIALSFCESNAPAWLAFQSESGPWTRALPDASHVFHVPIAARGGVAMLYADGQGSRELDVEYATAAELAADFRCRNEQGGGKSVAGFVVGLGGERATISLGSAASWVTSPDSAFSLFNIPDGSLDLIATRNAGALAAATDVIIRRGVNLANRARVPTLDFRGTESVRLSSASLAITGVGADPAELFVDFTTATGASVPLLDAESGMLPASYNGVPTALLATGDLHSFSTYAYGNSTSRAVTAFYHEAGPRSLRIGAALNVGRMTTAASTPYLRPRVELDAQADYGDVVFASWAQNGSNTVVVNNVLVSAGYVGRAPATWDVAVPDLTAAGFDPGWGLRAGVSTEPGMVAIGGASMLQLIENANGVDGQVFRIATRIAPASSTFASTSPARRDMRESRLANVLRQRALPESRRAPADR